MVTSKRALLVESGGKALSQPTDDPMAMRDADASFPFPSPRLSSGERTAVERVLRELNTSAPNAATMLNATATHWVLAKPIVGNRMSPAPTHPRTAPSVLKV